MLIHIKFNRHIIMFNSNLYSKNSIQYVKIYTVRTVLTGGTVHFDKTGVDAAVEAAGALLETLMVLETGGGPTEVAGDGLDGRRALGGRGSLPHRDTFTLWHCMLYRGRQA